eukprot:FR744384.1.p2 GENE.FR744384.1~~FR744384.1.p2  ORF type:complete len:116 (-),score=43.34 FR744384.1:646-993(-)
MGVLFYPLGPPRGFPLFVFGVGLFWGNCGGGNNFPPGNRFGPGLRQARKLTFNKGKKKREFPRGGGRFRNRGSPWLWTWLSLMRAAIFGFLVLDFGVSFFAAVFFFPNERPTDLA